MITTDRAELEAMLAEMQAVASAAEQSVVPQKEHGKEDASGDPSVPT